MAMSSPDMNDDTQIAKLVRQGMRDKVIRPSSSVPKGHLFFSCGMSIEQLSGLICSRTCCARSLCLFKSKGWLAQVLRRYLEYAAQHIQQIPLSRRS